MSERGWETQQRLGQRLQNKNSASPILAVVEQLGQLQQQVRRQRSSRRSGVVSDIARTGDQLFGIARGIEEAADFVAPEPFVDGVGELFRARHPQFVESELVDPQKSAGD